MKNEQKIQTFLSLNSQERKIAREMHIKGDETNGYKAFATLHEVWLHFKDDDRSAKRKDNIRRKIREIRDGLTELSENPDEFFKEVHMIVPGGQRSTKEYIMSFDGFMLLVLSFTGIKALKIRLQFIRAFTGMTEALGLLHSNGHNGYLSAAIRHGIPQSELINEISELTKWESNK